MPRILGSRERPIEAAIGPGKISLTSLCRNRAAFMLASDRVYERNG